MKKFQKHLPFLKLYAIIELQTVCCLQGLFLFYKFIKRSNIMPVFRIYAEKKQPYAVEAQSVLSDLNT
ncbi:MAG: hypothetical protein K2O42_07535, partial [Oscillospiraceae bacterium]|nr:hypothetical protein [Oscillospiraceae bacterium]